MGFFTYFLVPETKGVPIEAIEDKFRAHWVWGRIMSKVDDGLDSPTTAAKAAAKDAAF